MRGYPLSDKALAYLPPLPAGYFYRGRRANWAELGDRIEIRRKLWVGSLKVAYALHGGTLYGMKLAAICAAEDAFGPGAES